MDTSRPLGNALWTNKAQLSVHDGKSAHEKVRIPTAHYPHESWIPAKAPDFFAAVRQQGLRRNRVTRRSNRIFSNSLSQVVLSRTASQSR